MIMVIVMVSRGEDSVTFYYCDYIFDDDDDSGKITIGRKRSK